MLEDTLTKEMIIVEDKVINWEEAVKKASEPLIASDAIKASYIDAMINNVRELGPYIVIAPDIAIAHARPGGTVNKVGLSLLKLNKSINFGEDSHYAKLIFVLAAKDDNQHLNLLAELTRLLNDESNVELLKNSTSELEILNIIKKNVEE